MANGSTIGAKGEVTFGREDDASKRIVPWRIARQMGIVASLWTLGGYAFLYISCAWLISLTYPGTETGLIYTWRKFVYVITDLWIWTDKYGLLLALPVLLEWYVPLRILYEKNYLPKLQQADLPFAQADPQRLGNVTYDNWDDKVEALLEREGRGKTEPVEWVINATVQEGKGRSVYFMLRTRHAWAWHEYAKDMTRVLPFMRSNFSYRHRPPEIPAEEFKQVQRQCIHLGWAFQNPSDRGNGRVRHTTAGRAFWRQMAREPPPTGIPLSVQ